MALFNINYCDNAELAAEFEKFLEDNLVWSEEDFGGNFAWDAEIPARENWESEIAKLNAHLETVSASGDEIDVASLEERARFCDCDGPEYRIPIMDLTTDEANALTAAGWEYVSARCEEDGYMRRDCND